MQTFTRLWVSSLAPKEARRWGRERKGKGRRTKEGREGGREKGKVGGREEGKEGRKEGRTRS